MPSDSINLGYGGQLELSAKLMEKFGGADGISEKLRVDYQDATGPARRQIMETVTKIIANAAEIRGAADTSKMTSQQLREACLKLLKDHGGVPPWPEKPKESDDGGWRKESGILAGSQA